MSDLPMKQVDHPAHGVPDATEHYSGDTIDNSIDISNGEGGPFSLGHTIEYEKAVQDSNEVKAGTRFMDDGSRVPGALKARNDTYTAKIKAGKHY